LQLIENITYVFCN